MAARRNAANEDLSNVEFETSEDVEVIPTFNSMHLREELLRGIYAYGKWHKHGGRDVIIFLLFH